jgi:hypothetical protein
MPHLRKLDGNALTLGNLLVLQTLVTPRNHIALLGGKGEKTLYKLRHNIGGKQDRFFRRIAGKVDRFLRGMLIIVGNGVERILTQFATGTRQLIPGSGIIIATQDGFGMGTGMTIHKQTPA